MADLGCGNGVLSAFAATQNPSLVITGFDESYMAVASAQETFRQNHLTNGEFLVSNCLSAAKDRCFDMIVCNPPFHQQRRVTTDTALKMFREAHQKLVTGGTLWIVANRHLGYHTSLKRRFGQCQTVAANNKFVILSSTKESITNE